MATLDDLRALGYQVDVDGDVVAVRGYGVAISVNAAEHPEVLDSIADRDAHAERRFQSVEPEAFVAREQLRAAGYEVERKDPSSDTFTITGASLLAVLDLNPQLLTPAELIEKAQTL